MNPSYISESGVIAAETLNALAAEKISGGSMILMYTDRFRCLPQQEIEDTAHLLEARIFTETAELKIMRPCAEGDFFYRLIDDRNVSPELYLEETQYLDVDDKRSSGTQYTATGGGTYTLPVENARRLLIRNYISYDAEGIAQITDFRAVAYLTGGERENG